MFSVPRILVADQDESLRTVLRFILEDAGFHVTTAGSVKGTCALLGTNSFDLVVADSFTFSNSQSITETGPIRQAAGGTPVALCTAYPITVEQATVAGFYGLIAKPFELDGLIEQIRELLPISRRDTP